MTKIFVAIIQNVMMSWVTRVIVLDFVLNHFRLWFWFDLQLGSDTTISDLNLNLSYCDPAPCMLRTLNFCRAFFLFRLQTNKQMPRDVNIPSKLRRLAVIWQLDALQTLNTIEFEHLRRTSTRVHQRTCGTSCNQKQRRKLSQSWLMTCAVWMRPNASCLSS